MPVKKKVVFIIFNDLGIGGVQRKIVDISKVLKKEKDNISVYVLLNKKKTYDLEEDIFLEEVKKNTEDVFYKPDVKILRFRLPLFVYVFWKALKLKPNIILSFMDRYSVISVFVKRLLFWKKIKVVVSYDNIPSLLIAATYKEGLKSIYWNNLIYFSFKYADKIIVPSSIAKSDLIKKFNIQKDRVIVNKNWVKITPVIRNVKKKYDIIYTGRVDEVKNLTMFVDIVGKLKSKKQNIKACIVGWGKKMDEITHLIYKKDLVNDIELAGSQKNVKKYLSLSKIFLLTSKFEGLPISALEAMVNQLPVVTINYPGADELVINKKTGYVCRDIKDLVDRISYLLNNNKIRLEMGRHARKYIKDNHGKNKLNLFVDAIIDT